jgi:hypothetical protein
LNEAAGAALKFVAELGVHQQLYGKSFRYFGQLFWLKLLGNRSVIKNTNAMKNNPISKHTIIRRGRTSRERIDL